MSRPLHRLPSVVALLIAAVCAPSVAVAQAPGSAVDTIWHSSLTGPIPVIRRISGVRAEPGPFREYYQTPSGTSSGAHRHTADMHIHVISGCQFILMGDLDSARIQHFDAGSTFVIPANTWHVEWFEEDTLVEIFGVGPMKTERPPAVRRSSAAAGP